ncbi:MAG: rhodanese-like domain-containing protein [Alphaproteobacteria bacterium]
MKTISRNEIRELIERGENIALVEALPENFYDTGHLPGAIAIPAGHVADLAPELIPDRKKTVVVYCGGRICQNSAQAAEEFHNLGYSDVRRYVEGKEDWKSAGLPLERSLAPAGAD